MQIPVFVGSQPSKTQLGFTLLELMVTVAIVSILVSVAVPSFDSFIKNERLTSNTNLIISNLKLARSEAIKRNTQVIVCTSTNGTSCTGGSGESGWIVYADIDDSDSLTVGDDIIRVQGAIGNLSITTFGNIAFNNRGFSPDSNVVLSLCDDRGVNDAKAVTLSKTGQSKSWGVPTC